MCVLVPFISLKKRQKEKKEPDKKKYAMYIFHALREHVGFNP
jgi:hypothetical protein